MASKEIPIRPPVFPERMVKLRGQYMILSSWGITGIQGDTNQTTSTSCLSRMNDESEGRTLSQEISCTVLFLIICHCLILWMGGAQTLKANRYQAKLRKKLKIILFYSTKCTDGMYKRSRIFSIFVLSWRKAGQCWRKEGEGNAVVDEKHTRDIACPYAQTSSLGRNYHHDSHHCHCYR
jgi:hypothetical protein